MFTYDELVKSLRTPLRKPVKIDEVAEQQKYQRGQKAKQLLEDETLVEAFAAVEDVYMSAWRSSAGDDAAFRERCFVAISLLADIKGALGSYVKDGAVAFDRLEKNLRP